MGCSKSAPLPPPETIEVGKGGSTIMYGKTRQPDYSAEKAQEDSQQQGGFDVSKGGSLILCNARIASDNELDWEPGEPIQRPQNPVVDVELPHSASKATASRPGLQLRYGYFSERGTSGRGPQKPNQDSLIVMPFEGDTPRAMFGVFDGHGPFGEHASHFCRTRLTKVVQEHHSFGDKPAAALADGFKFVHTSFVSSRVKRAGIDPKVSGTTAVVALVDGSTLHVANCGDSRGIIVRGAAGDAVTASPVSNDHKPVREDERERISVNRDAKIYQESQLRSGGDSSKWYVCRINQGRIMYGVMFTRSIGDADATTRLGIIPDPEMQVLDLAPNDRFLVLATDGVWDVMTNEEVADIVAGADGAQTAAWEVVHRAMRKWDDASNPRRDDITAVVVGFDWVFSDKPDDTEETDETKADTPAAPAPAADAAAAAAAVADAPSSANPLVTDADDVGAGGGSASADAGETWPGDAGVAAATAATAAAATPPGGEGGEGGGDDARARTDDAPVADAADVAVAVE